MVKSFISVAALGFAVSIVPAHAAVVTFEYTESFGAVSPDGSSPWATATFDDGGGTGSVTLTMTASADIGAADITEMYFNLVDDSQTTLDGLGFTFDSGVEATNSVTATTNAFRAGGDGFYDILFDYPPPPGNATLFSAGLSSVYTITGTGLTANDFNVFGEPGPGGNAGPFLSVARFQSTGVDGQGSDFVGAVPVPAAVWLFGSGLLGLVGVARRKRS